MATAKQKQVARRTRKRTPQARSSSNRSTGPSRRVGAMSTAEKNRLPDSKFAFTDQRKEPLIDAAHVRNAVARFDQVEGVSDAERDRAWKRIRAAARKYDVDISVPGWRALFQTGKR